MTRTSKSKQQKQGIAGGAWETATMTTKPTILTNMDNSDNQLSAMTTVIASMRGTALQEMVWRWLQ